MRYSHLTRCKAKSIAFTSIENINHVETTCPKSAIITNQLRNAVLRDTEVNRANRVSTLCAYAFVFIRRWRSRLRT